MDLLSIKDSDMQFFNFAREVAEQSDFPRCHLGCVLVYQGRVLSYAHNTEKSDPMQKKYNRYRNFNHTSKGVINHSAHAEMMALKKVSYPIAQQVDWKRVRCYTYRICPGLEYGFGMARPCAACMRAMRDRGIRDFFYTTDVGYAHERTY